MTRILTRLHPDKAVKNFDKELLERTTRWMSEGAQWCSPIHERCESNNKFVAGETQWSEGDARRQQDRERPAMPMNKLIQVVNATANREIMNRYVSKVYPRSREDQGWADGQDEFLRWQRDMAEVEHEESMSFRSNITSGYAAIHTYYDPLEDDGRGLIMVEEIPIWGLLWDSRARKQNITDRRWHMHGKYVSMAEAEEEYGDVSPAAKKLFKKLQSNKKSLFDEDVSQNADHVPGRWGWDSIAGGRWYNRAEEELFIVESEWRDVKIRYKAAVPTDLDAYAALNSDPSAVIYAQQDIASGEVTFMAQPPESAQQDPNTGQMFVADPQTMSPIAMIVEVTGDTFAQMEEEQRNEIRDQLLASTEIKYYDDVAELDAFAQYYKDVTTLDFEDYAKDKRYCFYYAVVSDGVVLETGERPQGFTYEFLTGFPKATRAGVDFFGVVDVAKGPQDWRNTIMSLILTRLATSPKAPVILESDAVENLDDFLNQFANPRGPVIVPPGFINSNKMKEMPQPNFPPMERELLQMADAMVGEVAGLSGVDLGQAGDLRRISGTVVSSVKEASNTILALLFDSLRRYRKRSAKLVLRYMREFYKPDEVAEIVGPEKAKYIPEVDDWPDFMRFNIKIDEAPTSATERMELFDFLTRTGTLEEWQKSGVLPLEIILEWVPFISQADREKILQYRQQQQQDQQATAELQAVYQYLQQNNPQELQTMQQQGVIQAPQQQQGAPPGAQAAA